MATVEVTDDPAVLPAVCEILHLAFAAHDGRIDPPSGALRETPDTLAAKLDAETLLVARDPAGAILGCVFFRPVSSDEGYIGRMAVHPDHQRRGIAGELLRSSVALARSRAITRLGLDTRIELTEHIAFFGRHGFAITREDRHPGFDRPTAVHMELALRGRGDTGPRGPLRPDEPRPRRATA